MNPNTIQKIEYPKINPVPEGIHRPFWSVMIPTYNCANYLAQTLESVLAQDPGPEYMQIEVVDDYSTKDDPEAVVKEIGKGRVSFYRQPQNVGISRNFNTCIQRSVGQIVHILHGDDTVLPGFYKKLELGFQENIDIGAAFCRHIYMDDDGHWQFFSHLESKMAGVIENWLEQISVSQRIQFPSILVKRTVYEKLGGFTPELSHAADWEMWRRIAINYPFWFEPQPLACYRVNSSSHTSKLLRSAANIHDTYKSIKLIQPLLPVDLAQTLSKKAYRNYAFYAIGQSDGFLNINDLTGAFAQTKAAIICFPSLDIYSSALKVLIRALKIVIKRAFVTIYISVQSEESLN